MSILSDILGSTAVSTVAALTPAATVDIDLTDNDFFTLTPDQNTTFTVSNVPTSPDVGKFNLALTGFTTSSVTYDIDNAVYDSVSLFGNADPVDIHFKPDGTKIYILSFPNKLVYQYTLSTAWNLSTATYDAVTFSVAAQDAQPFGLDFKTDGTKMYIVGASADAVFQYTLSTAWDVSTASYDTVSFSVAAQEITPIAVVFKPDGTKMYILGLVNDRVYQYTLSTAWDVSTASYDTISFSVAGQDTTPFGLAFKPDGTKMYMSGGTGDRVYQYTVGSIISATTTYPAGFKFSTGTTPDAPLGGEVDILEFQTTDGGTTWYGTQLGNNFS